jgi:hypothetical protein
MRAMILMAAAALAGCAGAMGAKWLNEELQYFVGKNLSVIEKRIGPPDSKLEVLGSTVYTWTPQPFDCKLHLTTDPDGTIRAFHWEGDPNDVAHGCYHFSSALDLHGAKE